ncbi:MAG: chemotaxis protein CheW [Deltaproteobacteria bacterium]|nr:chemotaxis protein CheW [Deltaproteobacteria bacterium]
MSLAAVAPSAVSHAASTLQILTFVVNGDEYGVDILSVQEIRGWAQPMPIPNAPPSVRGVINIRGEIVPIVDLRSILGLPERRPDETTVVVVLRDHNTPPRVLGTIVDAMADVMDITREAIKPLPTFETTGVTVGVVTLPEKMISLLNPNALLPPRKASV